MKTFVLFALAGTALSVPVGGGQDVPAQAANLVSGKWNSKNEECLVFSASQIYCGKDDVPKDLLLEEEQQHARHTSRGLQLVQAVDPVDVVPSNPDLSPVGEPVSNPPKEVIMPDPVYKLDLDAFTLEYPDFMGEAEEKTFEKSKFVRDVKAAMPPSKAGSKSLHFGEQRTRVYKYDNVVLPDSGLCSLGRSTKSWGEVKRADEDKVMQMYGHGTNMFPGAVDMASAKLQSVNPFVKKMGIKLFADMSTPEGDNNKKMVSSLYDRLGFWKRVELKTPTSINKRAKESLRVKHAYVTCEAPAFHPRMAADFRTNLDLGTVEAKMKNLVIWTGAEGDVANEDELVNLLERWSNRVGYEVVNMRKFKKERSVGDNIGLFSRARLIMGPPGTGLYNQWLAPKDAKVIELQPSGYSSPKMHAHWLNSALIGQSHFIMQVETVQANDKTVMRMGKNRMEDLGMVVKAWLSERPLKLKTSSKESLLLVQKPAEAQPEDVPGGANTEAVESDSNNHGRGSPFPPMQPPMTDEEEREAEKAAAKAQEEADLADLASLKANTPESE